MIVKHANPCGVAVHADVTTAYVRANACDPVSAFGGIVAVNRPVPLALAEALAPVFTEVVVAPGYEPGALEVLTAKANLRVLTAAAPGRTEWDVRSIDGGLLVQQPDRVDQSRDDWWVVTTAQPTDGQWHDLEFAWTVCAAVSSNAIVFAKDAQAFGIGAGQQNRVDSARIAADPGRRPGRGRGLRQRRLLPVPRRARRRRRRRHQRLHPARRQRPGRRRHRRRRRARPGHGLHRPTPLPALRPPRASRGATVVDAQHPVANGSRRPGSAGAPVVSATHDSHADLLAAGRTYSFEFFPPKTDAAQLSLGRAIAELEPLAPSFVSVTYGAGGSTRQRTREVVTWVRQETAITPMAHLTCQGHTRDQIAEILDDYRAAGIDNILALGGDPPNDPTEAAPSDYTYATDLIDDVDAANHFSIGVAAHPEIHPRSPDRDADRHHLAVKLRRADFAITQFFFETEHYVRLVDEVTALGVDQPILPGIMPVTNTGPILRMAAMNGTTRPGVAARSARRGRRSGRGPAHRRRRRHRRCAPSCSRPGAPGLHFYTLNRSTATREIYANLGLARRHPMTDALTRPLEWAPPKQAISKVPYLPGLDGMRAIAVVAVMVYHANTEWLPGGFLGVEVFFVISGYLITLLLIGEHERTGGVNLGQFWLRRAKRLLPALYVLLILVIVYTAFFRQDALGQLRGDVIAALAYVSNWYQIWVGQGYTASGDFAPLRHLWSLAVEEQFYLVWPLVMVGLMRLGRRRLPEIARWVVLAAVVISRVDGVLYHDGPIESCEVTPEAYWQIAGRCISKVDALYLRHVPRGPAASSWGRRWRWCGDRWRCGGGRSARRGRCSTSSRCRVARPGRADVDDPPRDARGRRPVAVPRRLLHDRDRDAGDDRRRDPPEGVHGQAPRHLGPRCGSAPGRTGCTCTTGRSTR